MNCNEDDDDNDVIHKVVSQRSYTPTEQYCQGMT